MTYNFLKSVVLIAALVASVEARAAEDGIGAVTGTSTPQVVVPQSSAPPPSPSFQPAPIGMGGQVLALPASRSASTGARVVAPSGPTLRH